MSNDVTHWEATWSRGPHEDRGWFQPEPEPSLGLLLDHTPPGASVVDVGGGASLLADRLLDAGRDVTVVDLAAASLEVARQRLGARADEVTWVRADVTELDLGVAFDAWHDRAVLHFLLEDEERTAYMAALRRHLVVGGTVVIGVFAPDGPSTCSGLPVRRHSAADLADLLGPDFALLEDRHVVHTTPGGHDQAFTFAVVTRRS